MNKIGDYNFDDKLVTIKENLFLRKIKFKKELNRKSLNLLTSKNDKVIDNRTCNLVEYKDYKSKIKNCSLYIKRVVEK